MKDNPTKWHWVSIIAIAIVLLINASDVHAQSAFATITGRGFDPKAASMPNATATAANTETAGVNGISNDYAGLATTAPGVKYDFTSVSSDLLGPGAVNDRGILVNVDGGDISDQVVSTRDALGASLEEVKEFQVISNNYDAEYGQAGGVILNVVTKSCTNSFHCNAHGYFRGRNMTASSFIYNLSNPTSRAPFFKHER